MSISDWFDYVSDQDTPDEELNWEVSSGNHVFISMENDTLHFVSELNFFGYDTMIVVVSDDFSYDTSSVVISVTPINDPPVIIDFPDSVVFRADSSVILYLIDLATDVDDPDSSLKWSVTGNDFVMVEINDTSGTAILSAPQNWSGMDTLMFTVQDSSSDSDFRILPVHVFPFLTIGSDDATPSSFYLFQNYPNPFNPRTLIEYQLPKRSNVEVAIYNIQGKRIRTLVVREQVAGFYRVIWNGKDENGCLVPSGIYIYRIVTSDFIMTRRMLLIR